MDIQTQIIAAGSGLDKTFGAIIPPIYMTSSFASEGLAPCPTEHTYTRSSNPTRQSLEQALAQLEHGTSAHLTSSGMSAIYLACCLLQCGDHLISGHNIYGGTYRLFQTVLPRMGVEVTFVRDINDLQDLSQHIRPNTRMIWIETPSNPLSSLTDIAAVSACAKKINPNIYLCADNTFLTPLLQQPLDIGCDVVVHSCTKYINGHSDIIGGVAIAKTEQISKQLGFFNNALGLAPSPFDAWLMLRGLRTLPLRMRQHQQNATAIAEFLREHTAVREVYFCGRGGIVAFDLDTSVCSVERLFERVELFHVAVSLGGIESLIAQPYSMSHAVVPPEIKQLTGITPSIVRLALGLENTADLIADLDRALSA